MLSSCRVLGRSSLRTTYGRPPWSRRGENWPAYATGTRAELPGAPGYATRPGDAGSPGPVPLSGKSLIQPISGRPTGSLRRPAMPLDTPAAEVYQATGAV